jgi:hypothetical protein
VTKNKIIKSIARKVRIPHLVELLVNQLTLSELQSVLLRTTELKSKKRNLSDLLKDYQTGRFVRPSDIDPVIHRKLELSIFSLLPGGFEILDLSPLTPLGTSSILTTVHQNNVVSTIRNAEVAADTTNILALECALRRKALVDEDSKNPGRIKLCSAQRVIRGQPFEGKYFSTHFCVVALCTAGRDEGNYRFETDALKEHIEFYPNVLGRVIDQEQIRGIQLKFFEYGGSDNAHLPGFVTHEFESMGNISVNVERDSKFGSNYYSRLRFMISIRDNKDREFDYIDGGFTDWTSKLLNNRKERLLTSGIGTDYLLRTVKLTEASGRVD